MSNIRAIVQSTLEDICQGLLETEASSWKCNSTWSWCYCI